jgi:hypothetical protein
MMETNSLFSVPDEGNMSRFENPQNNWQYFCGLFNKAVSITDYMTTNGKTYECWTGEDMEGSNIA